MDENFRRYQPAILTWYETAQHAFDRGAAWQSNGGVVEPVRWRTLPLQVKI